MRTATKILLLVAAGATPTLCERASKLDGKLSVSRHRQPSRGSNLLVFSFNLEGRGGNQVNESGRDRRQNLADYFDGMCSWDTPPDVIFTQEDVSASLSDSTCFQEVARCASEEFWWTDDEKYGDGDKGGRMLNKIYVRENGTFGGLTPTSAGEMNLTSPDMVGAGLNPRCMAYAKYVVEGNEVFLGSFHMSGGYVDDAVVSKMVKDGQIKNRSYITKVRQIQLERMAGAAGKGTRYILGGDTNGLPTKQAATCQDYRLNNILLPEWTKQTNASDAIKADMKKSFLDYVSVPDFINGSSGDRGEVVNRVPLEALPSFGARDDMPEDRTNAQKICTNSFQSTSKWGGQPDQFYTNIGQSGTASGLAKARIEGLVGLSPRRRPPFYSLLSDHNPISLSLTL